jgi:hypothetical protein
MAEDSQDTVSQLMLFLLVSSNGLQEADHWRFFLELPAVSEQDN